ncbi:polysaccharide deacetylase family protein [Thermohalobacter berrensis]|uniref:NodB homology domain-containing protein n=1 Tax=Thermohalobacter berrensis TaxID=99594 RepID=A0A419T7U6_9FIRM|nr:polysaccharide deacetylase family protein [Thermohalobacter berrensis]RKD33509.1 hypothetical protein BET03_08975 [Thermohalobacter berrensis]
MKKLTLPLFILLFVVSINTYVLASNETTYVPVLTYHHIARDFPSNKSSVIITPDNFKKQMIYLKSAGFNTVTFNELVKAKESNYKLPPNPIIITFDDGYRSNFVYAYTILKELNMKGNINIVVSTVGETPGNYPHFTWDETKEMVESGVIEIGSHTYNLHNKYLKKRTYETDEQYYYRLFIDFKLSKMIIKNRLGIDSNILCFPYGYSNKVMLNAGKRAGFKVFLTTKGGVNNVNNDSLIIKRINVNGSDTPQKLLDKIYRYFNSEGLKVTPQ